MKFWKDLSADEFWAALGRLQLAMEATDGEFAGYLGLKVGAYRAARDRRAHLPALSVVDLFDRAHVSLERFADGKLDLEAVRRQRRDPAALPRRYLAGARSRRRNAITLLSYLKAHHGEAEHDRALRWCQVRAEALGDPDAPVNPRLTSDLCAYLRRRGYTDRQLARVGEFSTHVNRRGPLGQVLGREKSVHAVYERVFADLINRFDESFDYRLTRLTDTSLVVRVRERREVVEEVGAGHLGNAEACLMRGGVGAALPAYLNLPCAPMRKLSCIHHGDAECVYDFSLTQYSRVPSEHAPAPGAGPRIHAGAPPPRVPTPSISPPRPSASPPGP